MKSLKDRLLNSYKPNPFIGFEGIGSSISISDDHSSTIIKKSFGCQLMIILSLGVVGPALSFMTNFHWEEIKSKPTFILGTLFFFNIIGWIYFFKFLLQSVGNRRIERRHSDRSIVFYKFQNKVDKLIRADEIDEFLIKESSFLSENRNYPNYTLVLKDKNGVLWDLATTGQQESIIKLKEILES